MNDNILFIFNIFPGVGGLESVSNNIIDYISKDFTIYTLSMCMMPNIPASPNIAETFCCQSDNEEENIRFFNKIVEEKKITHIINQGIYPHITNIIFNPNRKKELKIISVLHGMPKYEKSQYWQLPHILKASKWKQIERKTLSYFGLNNRYKRYINSFSDSYRKACIKGNKVIVLCNEYITPFAEKYHLTKYKDKIIAIENPLSVSFSEQKPIEWSQKENQVIFVGRLSKEKQVNIILDVWKRIEKETNWNLTIVGDGTIRKELEQMVVDKQIQRITFTGQVDHPEKYYKSAKIILLTSSFEGFPMCLIEALRFGVVPLTFEISEGVRSIVSCSGGMTVTDNNLQEMSSKLIELINNENLFSLSEMARIKSNQYTLNRIGEQWSNLLKDKI